MGDNHRRATEMIAPSLDINGESNKLDTSFFLPTAMPYSCSLETREVDKLIELPLAQEIREWKPMPLIEKPEKVAISGTIEEIAAKSSSNYVGLINWVIATCRIFGITIKGMDNDQLIARLGQELQIEVDAFKTEGRADMEFIEAVIKEKVMPCLYANKQKKAYWLNHYKSREVFFSASLHSQKDDTISLLWNQTTKLWEEGVTEGKLSPFQCRPSWDFRYLMNWVTDIPESYTQHAMAEYRRYKEAISLIVKESNRIEDKDKRDEIIKEKIMRLFETFKTKYANPSSHANRQKMAAAFHNIFHSKQSFTDEHGNQSIKMKDGEDKCSLCFYVFPDIYKEALSQSRFKEFRLYTPDSPDLLFEAELVPVRVIERINKWSDLVLETKGEELGAIITQNTAKNCPPPIPGFEAVVRITSIYSAKKNKVSYHLCEIVDEVVSEED